MTNDTHVFELLPAYVLGSLDAEEARSVREHLTGCYLCRQELDAFQGVADELAWSVSGASPASDLSSRLMERIQSLQSERAAQTAARRPLKRLLPIGALSGLLLLVLLAVSNILLWQRLNNAEVLTGPMGMRAIALHNTAAAPAASGFVIMGADGRNGVLVVDKMPPLDASHEYQVWLERYSSNTAGSTFSVDEHGYRGIRLEAPESLLSYSTLFVTIEPAGGSPNPTGAEVLSGSLFNP